MQQVKLFKGVESELGELEKAVNAWLSESGATVIHMASNIAPQTEGAGGGSGGRMYGASDVLVSIVYETP